MVTTPPSNFAPQNSRLKTHTVNFNPQNRSRCCAPSASAWRTSWGRWVWGGGLVALRPDCDAHTQPSHYAHAPTSHSRPQAPDLLVNDATLRNLAQLLPRTPSEMALVSGIGQEAQRLYAQPLLTALLDFCDRSSFLKEVRNAWVGGGSSGGGGGASGAGAMSQVVGGGPAPVADDALLQSMLEARLLQEPKVGRLLCSVVWLVAAGVCLWRPWHSNQL
jgi:hypothetical protein